MEETTTTTTEAAPADKPATVPLKALEAERAKRQELAAELEGYRARAAERDAADKAEADKRAEQQGEYKRLLEVARGELAKLEAVATEHKTRWEAHIERLTASNGERLAALPETLRSLVPEGLAPEAAAAQIAKLEALDAAASTRPAGARRSQRGDTSEAIPAACEAEAARYGRDPRVHFETVWKRRKART